jgi:hypothetical protein
LSDNPNPTTETEAAKAGARHSSADREDMQTLHDIAVRQGAACDPLNPMLKAEDNALKAVSETDDELRVANYIVVFGGRDLEGTANGNKNADGSRGEFFTPQTILDSEATAKNAVMVDWEHATGRGKPMDGVAPGEFLGRVDWKTARQDERGVWVERILNRRNKFVQWLETLIKAGIVGNSSEADPRRVQKAANGEIKRWPLLRDTLTVSPMEPRMMTQNVVTALKALGYTSDTDEDADARSGAPGGGAPAAAETPVALQDPTPTSGSSKGTIEMDEKDLNAMIAAGITAALKAEKDAASVEAERQAKEQERIDAAVKAAVAAERKEWEARVKANGRLPMGGQAPVQARFADTRKYDGLDAADMAFMAELLGTAKHSNLSRGGVSQSALKALAIKVAEDKTEAVDITGKAVNLGEQGRKGLLDFGIDPADVLNGMKADELNYSTQAGFGDEWVVTENSRLPTIEVPQGAESVKIPLEAADPTFYKVAQTASENATTKTPDATVTSSKLATDNETITVAKGGARTQWAGEMEEDSVVPFVSQLRQQLERAAGEQMEHVLIDGDTETGATTNINDIGGTPAGTELFLLFNGFRKLPLVTATANATSVGALTDTAFLTIKNLMGAAGKNAADKQRVGFILDPNVYDKVLQLASVKTRDVFEQATIENGDITSIWGYPVFRSYFMHYLSTTNPYEANTAGKVDLDTQGNNTTGSILLVRWDQWLFGYKRRMTLETVRVPRADITEITALFRVGLLPRDTEASTIGYNVTL